MKTFRSFLLPLIVTLIATANDAPKVGERFVFEQAGRHVPVWYFQPGGAAANAPVVFVMHGVKRNAEDYLRDWAPFAEKRHFLLVVPEFSIAEFPGDEGYNYGNTVRADGSAVPRDEWSFNMIEPIFDAVRLRTGNQSEQYMLYGHSAGAQFVQRFVFFVPSARLTHAIAANAGWYMLPDSAVAFPYGLQGTSVPLTDVRRALGAPMTILLGTADTDPKHKMLRHTPEAEAQGPYRFARGQYYFAHARAAAAALKTPFRWSLAAAPGVAHSDQGMTPFAVDCLFPETPTTQTPKLP